MSDAALPRTDDLVKQFAKNMRERDHLLRIRTDYGPANESLGEPEPWRLADRIIELLREGYRYWQPSARSERLLRKIYDVEGVGETFLFIDAGRIPDGITKTGMDFAEWTYRNHLEPHA